MNLAAGFWHLACHSPSDLTSRDGDSEICPQTNGYCVICEGVGGYHCLQRGYYLRCMIFSSFT